MYQNLTLLSDYSIHQKISRHSLTDNHLKHSIQLASPRTNPNTADLAKNYPIKSQIS